MRVAKATGLAAILGLGMELVQFFIPDRGPTTTDVFNFAAGGAIGSIVYIWVSHYDIVHPSAQCPETSDSVAQV